MDAAGERPKVAGREVLPGVWVYPDADAVAQGAATRFVRLASEFVAREGKFAVALAGGSTPAGLYRRLVAAPVRTMVPWDKVHIFWGDERAVPPEHPESNYGMAQRELLRHIPIPAENVHRMQGEAKDLSRAAEAYEQELERHLARDARGWPRLHLVLLGLGEDGHAASLYPNGGGLEDAARRVIAPFIEKLGARRMTLTLPVLNAAHHVLFLVTGAGKAEALRRVLVERDARLPAAQVRPVDGQRVFLMDAAAAQLLQGEGKL